MEARTWKWQKNERKKKPQRNELHVLQRQNEVGMECAEKGRRDGLTIIIKKKKKASTTDSRFLVHHH